MSQKWCLWLSSRIQLQLSQSHPTSGLAFKIWSCFPLVRTGASSATQVECPGEICNVSNSESLCLSDSALKRVNKRMPPLIPTRISLALYIACWRSMLWGDPQDRLRRILSVSFFQLLFPFLSFPSISLFGSFLFLGVFLGPSLWLVKKFRRWGKNSHLGETTLFWTKHSEKPWKTVHSLGESFQPFISDPLNLGSTLKWSATTKGRWEEGCRWGKDDIQNCSTTIPKNLIFFGFWQIPQSLTHFPAQRMTTIHLLHPIHSISEIAKGKWFGQQSLQIKTTPRNNISFI